MPFPPVSILDAIIPGSTLLEPKTPSVGKLLGDLPRLFGDTNTGAFAPILATSASGRKRTLGEPRH